MTVMTVLEGYFTYGIPGFKLEKDVVMRRNSLLSEGGVNFELNTNIGIDISFNDIRSKHDAVFDRNWSL